MKSALWKALRALKLDFPGHLLSKLEQKMAECIPAITESVTDLFDHCDNEDLQV